MTIFPLLSERRVQPEIMDQPDLAAARHHQALRDLARINWISGSTRILWPSIRRLALENRARPLRVLDIASGGGDIPIRLCQRAKKAGLNVEWTGIDVSSTAIAFAREQARLCGAGVEFCRLDVLNEPLPGDFDVVTSSLFFHHLDSQPATELLKRMGEAARVMVLVNDLLRSRVGYVLAWTGTRLLSASDVVHFDGPRSVEAAFTLAEAMQMAHAAGLHGATGSWRWPFRFLLQWRRPH